MHVIAETVDVNPSASAINNRYVFNQQPSQKPKLQHVAASVDMMDFSLQEVIGMAPATLESLLHTYTSTVRIIILLN